MKNFCIIFCTFCSLSFLGLNVYSDRLYTWTDNEGVVHITEDPPPKNAKNLYTVNLGTGIGYSVLEMVKAFSTASKREVAYKIVDRRPGDIACCYADPALAKEMFESSGVHEMENKW